MIFLATFLSKDSYLLLLLVDFVNVMADTMD